MKLNYDIFKALCDLHPESLAVVLGRSNDEIIQQLLFCQAISATEPAAEIEPDAEGYNEAVEATAATIAAMMREHVGEMEDDFEGFTPAHEFAIMYVGQTLKDPSMAATFEEERRCLG